MSLRLGSSLASSGPADEKKAWRLDRLPPATRSQIIRWTATNHGPWGGRRLPSPGHRLGQANLFAISLQLAMNIDRLPGRAWRFQSDRNIEGVEGGAEAKGVATY